MTAARSIPTDHDPLRVILVGGGVAALEAIAALRAWAPGMVAPVVISASDHYVDRPMVAAEPFGYGPPRTFALPELCASLGATYLHDAVREVDPVRHVVLSTGGDTLPYDVLVVAAGAQPFPAFEHGVAFEREASPKDFDDVLLDLRDGFAPRVALIVPDGVRWSLPAYELALLTAGHAQRLGRQEAVVSIVTHEPTPLTLFGTAVSAEVARLLREAGVVFHGGVHADVLSPTALRAGGHWISADRLVALPPVGGPWLRGLPCDRRGFLPTDAHGRLDGVPDVFAAGDSTTQPVKQGGLAAQQGAIVAAQIAVRAGADVAAPATDLVLRGLLRTPQGPWFLRAELADVEGTSIAAQEPLWWPPTKIASKWLSPHLARLEREALDGATAARAL